MLHAVTVASTALTLTTDKPKPRMLHAVVTSRDDGISDLRGDVSIDRALDYAVLARRRIDDLRKNMQVALLVASDPQRKMIGLGTSWPTAPATSWGHGKENII